MNTTSTQSKQTETSSKKFSFPFTLKALVLCVMLYLGFLREKNLVEPVTKSIAQYTDIALLIPTSLWVK